MDTRTVRDGVRVTGATVTAGVVLIVTLAAFGVDSGQAVLHVRHPPVAQDLQMRASDFHNLHTMTMVRGFFVDNRLGHLAAALRAARAGKGVYPVGTILQLVPQEAMVKRRKGFSPATHDWEFFFLQTTPQGSTIVNHGTTTVVNRFGGNCASCHLAAQSHFDLVCEHNHGCAPLPVGDDVIAAIQRADPRPLTPPTS
ncbi:MAG TPA: hypothetical protein VLV81_10790 [Acidimicrobiia bacterium]|nr:hypothetical protein [Acidimicrobiia bacterium]